MISDLSPVAYLVLFGVVAFGAVVPVVPTGAAVSGAAVLAGHEEPLEIVLVVLVGGAGAYLGDLVTYGVLSVAGPGLARRVGWLRGGEETLTRLRERIEEREIRTLVVSRLVPGGRVPVLLVASLTGYPLARFVSAGAVAALLWAALYSVIGVAGDAVFHDQTTAVVVVVVAAVVVSVGPGLVRALAQRLRTHRTPSPEDG